MKSVFALIAAVAVIASAHVSSAASCNAGDKSGRKKFLEPQGRVTATATSSAVKATR